jgi:hypothetical protein
MINDLDFTASMGFLAEMLPMQRALTQEALAMAWETLPPAAKINLTPASLAFAVKQRLLDPQPPKEVALHISLLRYVFPVDRTTKRERGEDVIADRVMFENGPRSDLAQRMAEPDRFHDPSPARRELQPVKRLPESGFWHPSQMTPEERRDHLEAIAQQLERILAEPTDGNYGQAQLHQGRKWFERALQGFWTIKPDLPPGGGGICRAWCQRNAKWARDLLEAAMATDAPPPPAADAGIADFLAGAW